jgi:hypothetical protein
VSGKRKDEQGQGTEHWHPHEYPEATATQAVPISDHGTGAGIPQHDPTGGDSAGLAAQPAGAQTGHEAVDTGGAASGAGAGSGADTEEREFKADQKEAVEGGQVRGVAGEAEVAAARGDDAAQSALGGDGGTSDSSGGGGGSKSGGTAPGGGGGGASKRRSGSGGSNT